MPATSISGLPRKRSLSNVGASRSQVSTLVTRLGASTTATDLMTTLSNNMNLHPGHEFGAVDDMGNNRDIIARNSPAGHRRDARCRGLPNSRGPNSGRARKSGKMVGRDRKSTRLNSSHVAISYAVFCLKKKKSTDSAPK